MTQNSTERTMERILSFVIPEPNSGCWLWNGAVNSKGYGRVFMAGKSRFAHRVVWQITRGDIPTGLMVCHDCDTPSCVNVDHLFIGNATDNTRDMVSKGRGRYAPKRGEASPNAKLKASDVLTIRCRADTEPHGILAREYGVSDSLITLIVQRKVWSHIP